MLDFVSLIGECESVRVFSDSSSGSSLLEAIPRAAAASNAPLLCHIQTPPSLSRHTQQPWTMHIISSPLGVRERG